MMPLHSSLKSNHVKVSTVIAVPKNSNADKCSLTICLSFVAHFMLQKASECLTSCNIRSFQPLACWKGEFVCLQQQDSLECQDKMLGCGCITTRYWSCFWPTLQWAPSSNDPEGPYVGDISRSFGGHAGSFWASQIAASLGCKKG